MTEMAPIRVVLADDHTLVRRGIVAILASPSIDVAGEAEDGRSLLCVVRRTRPDIALIDLSMPLLNGIEATRRILRISPETRVIIVSMHADRDAMRRAKRAGARGYVLKDAAPERLLEAVRAVARGEESFPVDLAPTETDTGTEQVLTSREREVLQLIVEGKRNKEIAEIMTRSVHTIRNHRARIMRKLGVRSATGLVPAAERLGIVRPASGMEVR